MSMPVSDVFAFRRFSAAILVGLAAAVCVSVTRAADDEAALPREAIVHRDIVYAQRSTGPMKLDLFTPRGEGPFPLVIWIHGGGWREGDKASWPHMNFLVREGFAVANVEYRFSQVAVFPAQLDDCTAALDYLAGHADAFHLDTTRVAVCGESAGGHLAALLGMTRSAGAASSASTKNPATQPTTKPDGVGRVGAVMDLFGPTDLAAAAGEPQVRALVENLVGGPIAPQAKIVRDASPMSHVAKDNPPFLILHGTKDTLVPIAQSEQLAAALKAAGVPADFVRVEGAGHAGGEFWTPAKRARMVEFLRMHLTR